MIIKFRKKTWYAHSKPLEFFIDSSFAKLEIGLTIVNHIKRGLFPVKPHAFAHLTAEIQNIKSADGQLYVRASRPPL